MKHRIVYALSVCLAAYLAIGTLMPLCSQAAAAMEPMETQQAVLTAQTLRNGVIEEEGDISVPIKPPVTPPSTPSAPTEKYVAQGTLDNGIRWTLDLEGTLQFQGSGAIDAEQPDRPWWQYRNIIRALVFDEGITGIGSYAFESCQNLQSVQLADSITSIAYKAFENCISLTDISIPASVTQIDVSAFADNSSLTGIWVDKANPTYSSDEKGILFNKDQSQLIFAPGGYQGSYSVGESVQIIGVDAFYNCDSLTEIIIADSVTEIGVGAFRECEALKDVTLSSSITRIDPFTFSGCTALRHILIPQNVTDLRESSFFGCSNLESVILPAGITSVEYAFYGTASIKDVYFLGTEDQWAQVAKAKDEFAFATIHFGYTAPDGDFDGDMLITDADAMYLLRYTLFPDRFPISMEPDVNSDGATNDQDAMYLLRYTLFPERFPLYPVPEQ